MAVISCLGTLALLGVASEAAAQTLQQGFYQVYTDRFDETQLSPEEQERKNRISYGVILGLLGTHNASIPLGFVPYPVWLGMTAEGVQLAADNGLKFTRAVLRAPPDLTVFPNATDPAFPADGQCRYEFTLPQSTAGFSNFLGLWPRLTYGPNGAVDRLFLPGDTPISFGPLGVPEIVHAISDVNLDVLINDDADFVAHSNQAQTVSLGIGVHEVRWNAATLYRPIWDTVIPIALIPLMASVEAKWGKYIDSFLEPNKTLRTTARELGSPTSSERRKLLRWLFVKINLLRLVKKAAPGLAEKGTEAIIDYIFEGQPVVGRARLQRLSVYDILPPTIAITDSNPVFEATDIGGTRTSRYLGDLMATVIASDPCGRPYQVSNDIPEVLPLGDTLVTWTVRDAGPVPIGGFDHDGDGIPDSDPYNSRTVTQIVTVEDTQAPILVPPPGVVLESTTSVDIASQPLGQPLVVDLADLHPTVTSSASSSSVIPDTRTVVTWTATDFSGNPSSGDQLVTVKTPGTNTAPVVGDEFAQTLTSRPVDIVLTGVDADMLPYTDDPMGPGIADPLQFKIEQLPQNGEFEAPLYPFFIDDYRTDKVGGLVDYINAQPDPETLMASYILAVNTNSLGNWMNNEFCSQAIEAPVDFVFEPQFVQVADNGEQYFFDRYLVCDPNGTNDPPWATRPRISRWSADRVFLGAVRIDDGGAGSINDRDAVFRIDNDGFIYFVDNTTGGESGVLSIQRCSADLTNTTNNPPYCLSQSFFGPIDMNNTTGNGTPENALIDADRGFIYINTSGGVAVGGVDVFSLADSHFFGTLADDSVGTPVTDFMNTCGSFEATQFFNSMETDSEGNLYVIDGKCDRIHKFAASSIDAEGQFVAGSYVGWMGRCNGSNNLACDVPNERTKGYSCTTASACTIPDDPLTPILDSGGSKIGQFQNPAFLAIDPNDVLYVADYDNARIQRFGPDGTFAGQAKSTGNGINAETDGGFILGNMGPPKHVTVNSRNFFVVDQSNNFVHIFDTSPFKDVTDSSATVTYVSDFAFHSAIDTFVYSVNDGLIDSNFGTVSISVARNYRQPLPTEQAVTTPEDTSTAIVLSGTDPDGILDRDFNGLDSLTFKITRLPEHGTLIAGGDPGGITVDPGMTVYSYTPDRDYHGPDSFAFTVRDAFTDATVDGGTAIPEPYGEADPVDVAITVEPVNDVPIVRIDQPERVAAGFPYVLNADAYDDISDDYAARVLWGDGAVDRDGEAQVDDGGTPNDPSDDTSTMTGVVYSKEGLTSVGQTQLIAMHTYTATGARTVTACLRDAGFLESCNDINVDVESLALLSTQLRISAAQVYDGIPFTATIEVLNAEPTGGVTGLGANEVRVAMDLPPELIVTSASSSQGTCSIGAALLDCTLGSLANGATATIGLALRGTGTLIYDTSLALRAEASTSTPSLGDYGVGEANVALTAVPNDRDGDGLPNIFEAYYGVSDPAADDDGDGLDNAGELAAGTSPTVADTDGDGVSDGEEVGSYGTDPLEADTDGDGLGDFDEITVHGTDPLSQDSDNDGLPDLWEVDHAFDPLLADSDGDADGDGLSDAEEYAHSTDYVTADTDGDGLDDGEEVTIYGTDPVLADTDGDGLDDGAELVAGADALKPDSDDDGLDDGPEVLTYLTDPTLADTDRDGLPDGWEIRNGRLPLVADYAVAAGGLSSCALTDAGVECWGRNDFGQAPAIVPGLNDPQAVTVGYIHACAIDRSPAGVPSVVCWGRNDFQQLAIPALVAPFRIAAGGYHTCALDRTTPTTTALVCWGRNNYGQTGNVPMTLENPVELVSGISGNTSCVIDDATGGPELVCWGRDDSGEVSSAPTVLTSLKSPLAMGSEHGCVVDNGERVCWGLNTDGQAPPGPTPTPAAALALGGFHSCSLDSTGRDRYGVSCWGLDVNGQADVPTTLVHPIGIAAGSHHTCALDDGAAKCWGVTTQFNEGQAPALRALDIDSDGDGLPTADEIAAGTDPLDADSDRDGLPDAAEIGLGTDPLDRDSDGDGLSDGDEANLYSSNPLDGDTDGDGLPDEWEADNGSQIAIADAFVDADADGLDAGAEYARGTDPNVADTDGDAIADGAELDTFRYEDSGQALGSATSEAVALGDLDGDGDLDAFVGNQAATHDIWLNDGTGVFSLGDTSALNAFTAADVDLFDVDFDGDLDAYLSHPDGGVASSLWLNDGAAVYSAAPVTPLAPALSDGAAYGRVALAPQQQDMGMFIANWGANQAASFRQPLSQLDGNVGDPLMGNSEDVALADFNGDGLDDAFVVNRGQPDQIFLNTGDPVAAFVETTQLPRSDDSTAVDLGDIDHDGDVDAYEVVEGAGDRLWINGGAGSFTDSGQSLGSDAGADVSLVDIDSDGYPEALVANAGPNRVWLNSAGVLADSGATLGSATSYGVDVGDLDGDGDPDAFFANAGPNEVWLLNQLVPGEADTDGDGAFDGWEIAYGLDPLDAADGALDGDGDGLTNGEEFAANSEPILADTDGDGMSDGFEVANGLDPLDAADASADYDADGLTNVQEFQLGSAIRDTDTDNDSMGDAFEASVGLNPAVDDAALDLDGDGLSNFAEFLLGTTINNADSDGDGMSDGYEVANGLNPLSPDDAAQDLDGDGLTNLEESVLGTAADDADTDHDGIDDATEIANGTNPLVNERGARTVAGSILPLLLGD